MPILQKDNPVGDILSSLIAAYGVSQKQKQQKLQNERQAKIDAQNAALSQAQLQGVQQENQERPVLFQQTQRSQGINPATGQPFNYGYTPQQMRKGMSSTDPNQLATFYGQLAARAMSEGAYDVAGKYSSMAQTTQQQAIRAADETLKFQQFAEKLVQDQAQRQHLTNMDQAAIGRLSIEASRLAEEVSHNRITESDAEQNLQLRAREFGLSQQRFKLEQQRGGTKTPPGYSEIMTNLRQNANFKALDPNVQTVVTQSLASGRSMASVVQTLQAIASGKAKNPNITQQEATDAVNALTTSNQ